MARGRGQAARPAWSTIAHDFTLQPGIPLVKARRRMPQRAHRAVADPERVQPRPHRRSRRAAAALARAAAAQGRNRAPVRRVLDGSARSRRAGLRRGGRQRGPARLFPHALHAADARRPRGRACRGSSRSTSSGWCATTLRSAVAGYQPMGLALDLLERGAGQCQPGGRRQARSRAGTTPTTYAAEADQPRIAKLARDRWLPRLRTLGLRAQGQRIAGRDLAARRAARRRSARSVSRRSRPRRGAASRCSTSNPKALDGPLKTTWLGIVARNANAAEWERLLKLARSAPNAGREAGLLRAARRRTTDEALAQRALDLALTGEAGPPARDHHRTVALEHPDLRVRLRARQPRQSRGAGRFERAHRLHRRPRGAPRAIRR